MEFPPERFGQRPANYYEQYQYANYYDRDGGGRGGGDVTYNHNNGHQRGRGRGRGYHHNNQRGGWKSQGQHGRNNDDQGGHRPWMTQEILDAIKERNDLQRKAQESGSPDDWSIFKAVRNRTALLLNDAKRLYEAAQAETMKSARGGKQTFYCDTCDRSFGNQELLNEHNAEHVTCKLDGCSFTAHPKVILKHIEMQHSNNLFSRVRGYDTPEDIEKWKLERKSKFPTVDNIKRQQEEREERQQRGERMPLTDNEKFKRWQERKKLQQEGGHNFVNGRGKPFNSRGRGGMPGRGRQFNNNANRFDNGPRPPRQTPNNDTEPGTKMTTPFQRSPAPMRPRQSDTSVIVLESFYVNVKVGESGDLVGKKMVPWDGEIQRLSQKIARTGLPLVSAQQHGEESEESEGEMEAEKVDDITDEEEDQVPIVVDPKVPEIEPVKPSITEPKVPTASALGLVDYSCDSDSDAEPPTELPIDSRKEEGELEEEEDVIEKKPVGGPTDIPPQATPESRASVKMEPEDRPPKRNYESRDSKGKPPGHEIKRRKRSRMPRLLQKLLQGDIRHERNQILQVCRFIVQNKFFDDQAGVMGGSGAASETCSK